jgi:hypothetical protein
MGIEARNQPTPLDDCTGVVERAVAGHGNVYPAMVVTASLIMRQLTARSG